MGFIPSSTHGHPLSPRHRRGRVILVVIGLLVLWGIDPEFVETVGTWLGITAVLVPETFSQRRDEPPGTLSIVI
ncbi:hypothetical protein [Streptomyces sp. NPDC056987]|uniref:hypothetical protein n=1 Tax=Streptomyces sp. NPDC056987 TaxID=3345988 RepID=UPI00364460DF